MLILSDIQPQYFPRLHYFARVLASDVFVLRDDVQFVRNHKYPDGRRGVSYQAHTPIKAPDGDQLLAVSVKSDGPAPIHRTSVSYDQKWARKHVNVINTRYRKSPNRDALMPDLERLLACRFATLAELDIATTCWALGRVLDIELRIPDDLTVAGMNALLAARPTFRLRRVVLGSDCLGTGTGRETSATERIIALCKRAGAGGYLAGRTAARSYLDAPLFHQHDIELSIQDWRCPPYAQQHMDRAGFIPDLSILDLLMNAPSSQLASFLEPRIRGSEADA